MLLKTRKRRIGMTVTCEMPRSCSSVFVVQQILLLNRAHTDGRFEEFCFLCFQWFSGSTSWKHHATQHLAPNGSLGPLPLRCNIAQFRHNLSRPGFCPECLGDDESPPEDRFHQYINATEWKAHVLLHLGLGGPGPRGCRHPRCGKHDELGDLDQHFHHLADVHQVLLSVAEREKVAQSLRSEVHRPKPQAPRRVSNRLRTIQQKEKVFVAYTPRCMKPQTQGRNTQKSLLTLNGADKEDNCGSTTVHSHDGKQEVDTPIALVEKAADVDIPPLQHDICQNGLVHRDIGPLWEPEQSTKVVDVPPGAPGQEARGSEKNQSHPHLEVMLPQLPPKANSKKQRVSDSTASSAGKSTEDNEIEAPVDVRPPVNGVRKHANITIEIPPLPVDWWAWKEIDSPIKGVELGPYSACPRTPRPQPKDHHAMKRPRGRPRRVPQTPKPPQQPMTIGRPKRREIDRSPNASTKRALRTHKRKSPSEDNISEKVPVEYVSSSISNVHVSPVRLPKKLRFMSPTISPPLLSNVDQTGHLAEDHLKSLFLPAAADPMMADLGDVESAWYSNDIIREPGLQLENDWSADRASTSYTRDDRLFSQFLRARSPPLLPSCVSKAYSVETTATEGIPNLSLPPEDVRDDEPDIDMLFDQYLHSSPPSPSTSAKDTLNEFNGVTLIDDERDQHRSSGESCPQTFKPSALEEQAGDQAEDPHCVSTRPRKRQAKIMLHLKLQDTGQRKEKKQTASKVL
jgi:hypothetical protein